MLAAIGGYLLVSALEFGELSCRLVALFDRVVSMEDFERQFAQAFADDDTQKGRVAVAALDFEDMRLRFLN